MGAGWLGLESRILHLSWRLKLVGHRVEMLLTISSWQLGQALDSALSRGLAGALESGGGGGGVSLASQGQDKASHPVSFCSLCLRTLSSPPYTFQHRVP